MENGGIMVADLVDRGSPVSDDKAKMDGGVGNVDSGYSSWEIDMRKVSCINQIGAGAFGSVYYGLYEGNEVAVKLMNVPNNFTQAELIQAQSDFKQEVAVWSTLKHPNVVEFVGATLQGNNVNAPEGDSQGLDGARSRWAIVSEYMSGGTLKEMLNRRKNSRLPLTMVLSLALDIARGFEYLHSKGLVHRDLKSENILLDGNGVAKVADFGVARTEAANPVDMTAETGTVRWMAPEVIDHQPYDHKVDVYSFAIVLWELYTCDHPFKNFSFVQLAFAVVTRGERPPIPVDCPPELAYLMNTCWDASPKKRPEFSQVVEKLKILQTLTPNTQRGGQFCGCAIL